MRQLKIALAVFAALVMSTLLLTACGQASHEAPETATEEPVAQPDATPEPAAAGGTYTLTDDSKISWVGSKVTGAHEGGFNDFDGTITVTGGDAAGSSVDVTIDVNSLWADADNLVTHLKSPDFFDVENYPTARFTSTSVTANDGGGHTVTGNLDLHGNTKEISFPADIQVSAEKVTATAEFTINRFEYGINFAGKPNDLIADEVKISLDLTAVPAGSETDTLGDTDDTGADATGEGTVNDLDAAPEEG